MQNFPVLILAENMHFFIAYFLGEISKFWAETSQIFSDSHLFTKIRWIWFKCRFKIYLNNSTTLSPKNGGFKAWSHSVRKAVSSIISRVGTWVAQSEVKKNQRWRKLKELLGVIWHCRRNFKKIMVLKRSHDTFYTYKCNILKFGMNHL